MEENFKNVIEEIKNDNMDVDETKKYILSIKKVLGDLYNICITEGQTDEEIVQIYLREYGKDLEFRGNVDQLFYKILLHSAYKKILTDFKRNKPYFDEVIREARSKENADNKSSLTIKIDAQDAMITAIRFIIRKRHLSKEKEIIEAIIEEKNGIAKEIRSKMIKTIQSSVRVLNEYGFIDEYIASSNEELKQLGLGELQYENRNPIADKQYDGHGKLVHDVEDIGVIDTFDTEYLEQLSLEDLQIMTAFWESKYLQERIGLSKAMSTIKTLDLWDIILHEDYETIQCLDDAKVKGAMKKDLALTYLCRNSSKITEKMKVQYKKFLQEEGMPLSTRLTREIEDTMPEITNLASAANDVAILECLILYQLVAKDIKLKKWGIVEGEDVELSNSVTKDTNGTVIAIENSNFRGPLIMEVPEYALKEFFGTTDLNFPRYDKELDEKYSSIMSKLYLPTNKYFTNLVKKAYKENPSSKFLADLAGKKVQPPSGDER